MTAPAPFSGADAPTVSRVRQMISVASGKGGVGKTFLSISLATALAKSGRKVLLFDGDLGLANVDVQLGIMAQRDIAAVVAGKLTLPQARMRYSEGGFDVIAGRSGAAQLANIPPSRLGLLAADLAELAPSYDIVIVDLGAGLDRMVRLFSAWCATRLIVTTAEPTALTDAYALIKVSLSDDPTCQPRIIINQARSQAEGERTHATLSKACENFLRFSPQLAGVVRRDRHVSDTIRAQTPILLKFPASEAAQDVQAIAAKLIWSM
jgi:flagellar biosynthesis protein FlhG